MTAKVRFCPDTQEGTGESPTGSEPIMAAAPRTIDGDGPGLAVEDLKRKDVSSSVFETTISTEQCRRILQATKRHDVNYRSLQVAGPKLQAMAESMRNDHWVWTDADPIRLQLHVPSGEIVCSDGQHRLYAAWSARRTLRTLVLWGDNWSAGVHVDKNRPRNIAQFLEHEHGVTSATVYVAAARTHLGRLIAVENKYTLSYARGYLSDEEVIDFILANKDRLQWSINKGTTAGTRGFSTTGYHVFMFELTTISQQIADEFHEDFKNPDLDVTDPLAQLRRSIGRRFQDTGVRATAGFTLSSLVKAHNLRAAHETLSKWINVTNDDVTLPAGFKLNGQQIRSNQ